MKKVVFVTGSMIRGGAEGVIASVANGLAKRGWKVYIISLLFEGCDYELDASIECINLARMKENKLFDSPRMILALRKTIKYLQSEIVVSFMVTINIVTWIATRGLKTKFIPSERNDPDKGTNSIIKILQKKAYGAADIVVFQTTRAMNFFPREIRNKGVIIPNPVRKMPKASSERKKTIVTAGRLEEQKNHKLLIDAFSSVYKTHKDFTVDIYGDGTMKDDLRRYIEERQLTEVVHLCGKIDNVPEHIRNAYMFVLSSDYEGLSNALLEAMAVGLPCITTNCAGSEDAIQSGKNGLIVPVGSKKELEDAISWMIENPADAMEIGKKARESMHKYNYDNIINQWENLLSQ